MTAPIESIAVMTDRAPADDDAPPAGAEPRSSAPLPPEEALAADALREARAAPAAAVAAGSSDQTGAVPAPVAPQAATAAAGARTVSPNVMIGLLGTLLVAVVGAMTGLLTWQMSALADRIDRLDAKIDTFHDRLDAKIDTVHDKLDAKIDSKIDGLRTEIDGKIDVLRAEMQAGFREVNATLLDHTERLARLETAVGLSWPAESETSDEKADQEP